MALKQGVTGFVRIPGSNDPNKVYALGPGGKPIDNEQELMAFTGTKTVADAWRVANVRTISPEEAPSLGITDPRAQKPGGSTQAGTNQQGSTGEVTPYTPQAGEAKVGATKIEKGSDGKYHEFTYTKYQGSIPKGAVEPRPTWVEGRALSPNEEASWLKSNQTQQTATADEVAQIYQQYIGRVPTQDELNQLAGKVGLEHLTSWAQEQVYEGAFTTGNEQLDTILNQMNTYLDNLLKNGNTINPNIEITADKAAEFLAQAQGEISPYYAGQLKLAREALMTGLGYTRDEVTAQEAKWERQYGQNLRTLGEQMAESGFAYSGKRNLAEGELATETQDQIAAARRQLGSTTGNAAREFAQLWGTNELPTLGIAATPTVKAGEGTFQRSAGEMSPIYQLSNDVYNGLIGEKQWQQKTDVATRQKELESAFKSAELTKQLRTLTV